MIARGALAALAALVADAGRPSRAEDLPHCSNRTIREVVQRAGCTLGDERCWLSSGGFCTDWVERKVRAREPAGTVQLASVGAQDVRRGDVAVFVARPHYAFVERVVKDEAGRPVAVDLSEYNYGTCWVDPDLMVTDRYKVVHRRSRVPLREVDGGFLRPRPVDR